MLTTNKTHYIITVLHVEKLYVVCVCDAVIRLSHCSYIVQKQVMMICNVREFYSLCRLQEFAWTPLSCNTTLSLQGLLSPVTLHQHSPVVTSSGSSQEPLAVQPTSYRRLALTLKGNSEQQLAVTLVIRGLLPFVWRDLQRLVSSYVLHL